MRVVGTVLRVDRRDFKSGNGYLLGVHVLEDVSVEEVTVFDRDIEQKLSGQIPTPGDSVDWYVDVTAEVFNNVPRKRIVLIGSAEIAEKAKSNGAAKSSARTS